MGNPDEKVGAAGDSELRGDALEGAGRTRAVRKVGAKDRDTDATVRLDDEEDTLYDDDLELEDAPPLANTTDGNLR
jgi:hypothetical protein